MFGNAKTLQKQLFFQSQDAFFAFFAFFVFFRLFENSPEGPRAQQQRDRWLDMRGHMRG